MNNKNIDNMKINNESINVLLTPELYGDILDEKITEMKRLKALQDSQVQSIFEKINSLRELKSTMKTLKKEIRFSKRVLRKEKRKLIKINTSLNSETNLISDLNESFKSQQKKYINLNNYRSKKYQ